MSNNTESTADKGKDIRALWASAKPTRHDFAAVVNELNSIKLVGEGSVFERGNYVPITHMDFFKAALDAFATDLKSKDRRSAKEWDYVNGAGKWLESGLAALRLAREGTGTEAEMAHQLALAEQFLQASLEVLSMRAQYFHDVCEKGMEEARQMAFLVEQGSDAVHSNTYKAAREALKTKLETAAAKQLAKSRLDRANKKKSRGKGNAGESE